MPATKSRPQPRAKVKIGDVAVKKATGKNWQEWFKILDRAGCEEMNHKQIVAVVVEQHGIGPWWQQMVTVGYEQARGLRGLHQKGDGQWEISVSKTINVPVGKLFAAWNNSNHRAKWLGPREGKMVIRKSTRPKSLRITWCDGRSNVDVNLFPKGSAKSSLQLSHGKLNGEDELSYYKKYWSARLEKLKSMLEAHGKQKKARPR